MGRNMGDLEVVSWKVYTQDGWWLPMATEMELSLN